MQICEGKDEKRGGFGDAGARFIKLAQGAGYALFRSQVRIRVCIAQRL